MVSMETETETHHGDEGLQEGQHVEKLSVISVHKPTFNRDPVVELQHSL